MLQPTASKRTSPPPPQAAAGPLPTALGAAAANGHAAAAARQLSSLRAESEAMMGVTCFDAGYYAAVHPDLAASLGREAGELYRHYEAYGMAEGRRHRCVSV